MTYGESDKGRGTILIVDDVEMNRIILNEIILDMGYHPVLAENGMEALDLIRESAPQLILTDISMPKMSGYELCGLVKGNEATRNIPIIFISAFDEMEDIIEGFDLGGGDYITKPFVPEIVKARVGVHLRLYEMAEELREMNRRLQVSVSEQLRQMEQEKMSILRALANIAEQNSPYGKKYMERLKGNCRILAQGLQLSPMFEEKISDAFIDTIELAASLCDIGNIGVPKEILQKSGELGEEETAIMQSHTGIGAKLLLDLHGSSDYNDFVQISADTAHYHHENWDGSGYPEHLAGNEIPLAAQIVSLMSRFCTLTQDGKDRQNAIAVMSREAGVKFNPDIFNICCKISRQLS